MDDICSAMPNNLRSLDRNDIDLLIKPVTITEVYHTLRSMPKTKSLGLDGLNIEFYLFYWHIVGDQIFKAINYFFQNATLPNAWGRTYDVLISQSKSLRTVTEYRPIFLCNVSYITISKILANKFNMVIHKLVNPKQNDFSADKYTKDNIIAIDELAHSLGKDSCSLPRMMVRIDLEKVYDSLKWNVVLPTLSIMGFQDIWVSWVRACSSTCNLSFLINGQPLN